MSCYCKIVEYNCVEYNSHCYIEYIDVFHLHKLGHLDMGILKTSMYST